MGRRIRGLIPRLFLRGKRLGVSLAAFLLLGAGALMTPAPTLASAYGCSFGNPWMGPSQYCVYLSGSGTYVNYVSGSFRGSAPVCNAYITAEFFNNSWGWYQTINSRTLYGCMTGADLSIGIYAYKQPGYMCSTLHYYTPGFGNRTMSVCHHIY